VNRVLLNHRTAAARDVLLQSGTFEHRLERSVPCRDFREGLV